MTTDAPVLKKPATGGEWRGQLADLYPLLCREAVHLANWSHDAQERRKPNDDFAFRTLPSGLVIAVRFRFVVGVRCEIRLARGEALSEAARPKWKEECETVAMQFGVAILDGKETAPFDADDAARGRVFCEAPLEPSDEGKTVTRWIALRHGEARPGVGVCAKCGTETAHVPGLGIGQRCDEHRRAQ